MAKYVLQSVCFKLNVENVLESVCCKGKYVLQRKVCVAECDAKVRVAKYMLCSVC